jgi:hypothetical protein
VHVTRAFSAPPHGCLPHFCVWSPPGARLEPWSHSCTPRFRTPLKPLLRPRDTCRARLRPLSCCPPAVLPRLGPLPRAWCLRGPSCCGLLATKLSASAAIKEVVLPPTRATVVAARLGHCRPCASALVHSHSHVKPLTPSSYTT